ncbi:MAG: hypothetical protein LC624_07580, partial [Halobacteriales archaeon]|nr:hypothetical protein [Halobacteriales archaeon]
SESITQPSLINLDYADVRTIMGCGGVAVMLYGEAKSNEPSKVVQEALNHPLLDVDYKGATGALIHITGGQDLTLRAAEEVAENLTIDLDQRANVIWGARVNDAFEGRMRVMAIMTGVNTANSAPEAQRAHARQVAGRPAAGNLEIPWVQ